MKVTPIGAETFGFGHPRLTRGSNVARDVPQLASPFRIDRITDNADFFALRPAWNELLDASDSNCIFLTWEWISAWWQHFGGEGTLAVFVVRLRDEITAIAPFRMRPASFREKPGLSVLEFLGSGYAGSDYLDVIVRRGYEEDSLGALARALQCCCCDSRTRFAFRWTNIRPDNCAATRLGSILQKDGWAGDETTINVCPYISLDGCTWESYLEGLGAEHRYNFRRKQKRLNRDFRVEFVQAGKDDCRVFIDRLIEQHNLRWEARGGSDAFHTQALIDFHRDVTQAMLDRGWLRLYALRLDERPAAFLYAFFYRGKFFFYQSSFDAVLEKHSVGTVIMGLAIQRAIEEGAVEFDLLHGDETYKQRWSREKRSLVRLELYPPGWRGRLNQRYMKVGRLALKLARRVLDSTAVK